jgi:hypothetical protein
MYIYMGKYLFQIYIFRFFDCFFCTTAAPQTAADGTVPSHTQALTEFAVV